MGEEGRVPAAFQLPSLLAQHLPAASNVGHLDSWYPETQFGAGTYIWRPLIECSFSGHLAGLHCQEQSPVVHKAVSAGPAPL